MEGGRSAGGGPLLVITGLPSRTTSIRPRARGAAGAPTKRRAKSGRSEKQRQINSLKRPDRGRCEFGGRTGTMRCKSTRGVPAGGRACLEPRSASEGSVVVRLLAPQLIAVYALAASAAYVHFRGRHRLRIVRQLGDHSTYIAPYNVLMYLFSAVPNKPVLSADQFPELRALRENWQTIRDEAVRLFDEGRIRAAVNNDDWGFYSFFRSGWKRFYLKWYDDFLPSAQATCPNTVALLQSIPTVHGAMFAVLPPGAKLGVHRDPFAGSLRYHLGLVTPASDKCCIYVDGVKCVWRDGEDLVFDETFIHTAENETDVTRIILFCDVERPLKFAFMTRVNRWVSEHVIKASASTNVAGERVGIINRAFGRTYGVYLSARRLKTWNRKVYYSVKWSFLAAIWALLLFSVFA